MFPLSRCIISQLYFSWIVALFGIKSISLLTIPTKLVYFNGPIITNYLNCLRTRINLTSHIKFKRSSHLTAHTYISWQRKCNKKRKKLKKNKKKKKRKWEREGKNMIKYLNLTFYKAREALIIITYTTHTPNTLLHLIHNGNNN